MSILERENLTDEQRQAERLAAIAKLHSEAESNFAWVDGFTFSKDFVKQVEASLEMDQFEQNGLAFSTYMGYRKYSGDSEKVFKQQLKGAILSFPNDEKRRLIPNLQIEQSPAELDQ